MEPTDAIWKLLGKSPLKEADAWFTARTIARIRNSAKPFSLKGFSYKWQWITALACTCMLTLSFWNFEIKPTQNSKQIQEAFNYLADRDGDNELWFE